MKLETAQAIFDASDEFEVEFGLLKSYSGRYMYGKRTAAVTVEGRLSHVFPVIAHAAVEVYVEKGADAAREFVRDLRALRHEELGHDIVIY